MQGDTEGIGGEGEKVRQLRDTDRGEEEEEAGESPSIIQEANEQSRAKGEGDGKVDGGGEEKCSRKYGLER